MRKVIMTKGLPGSGKSTWSKQQVEKGGFKRISKDDLRTMMDNYKFSKVNERIVEQTRDFLILKALENGFTPIVDDTNLSLRHENHIRELVKGIAEIEIKEFNVPLEECIKRDLERPRSVGEKVIKRMWNQFYKKTEQYNGIGLPKAIICDIDGTLADGKQRGPFDWKNVGGDTVKTTIASLFNMPRAGFTKIIVSGRDSICRGETEAWLDQNGIQYDYLFMRPEGDNRKDCIVKREIFDNEIRDKYDVEYVLDDRNQVVEMWRDLGLTVLQVADGDF